jgi:hypothetical protein
MPNSQLSAGALRDGRHFSLRQVLLHLLEELPATQTFSAKRSMGTVGE